MASVSKTTCVNSSQGTLNGFGVPILAAFDQTALAATGTITLASLSPAITKGKIRIQINGVNVATTLAIGAITATDGITPYQVGPSANVATTAAGTFLDFIRDFVLGINATSFAFTVTLAGGTQAATVNTELFGTP